MFTRVPSESRLNVVSATLGAEAKNVREARRFVERTLLEWSLPGLVDLTTLLASELVTNAILHAHSGVDLTLELTEDRVRVEVHDHGGGQPVHRDTPVEATSGRGLGLVDRLSVNWGVIGDGLGKSVWFELLR